MVTLIDTSRIGCLNMASFCFASSRCFSSGPRMEVRGIARGWCLSSNNQADSGQGDQGELHFIISRVK